MTNFLVIILNEEERMLLDKETGEIILDGDAYHDKIAEKIDGFFACLDYFNYPYTREEEDRS